jgi:hypothetical protein
MADDVATLIADMVREGVSAEICGRVAAMLAKREPVIVKDEQAERRRAADRVRKSIPRNSAESAEQPSPLKMSPHTPLKNTPPIPTTSLRSVVGAPAKRKRAEARSQIAPDAMPTPADVEAAKRAGFDKATMQREWPRFRDHHRAKGSLMADWGAAWRTWVGNANRFQQPRAGPQPGQYRNGLGAIAAELFANDGRETEKSGEAFARLPFDGYIGQDADGGDAGVVSREHVEILVGSSFRRM